MAAKPPQAATVAFSCYEHAGAGQFTVPSYILQQLPATPAGDPSAGGYLLVGSSTTPVPLTSTAGSSLNLDYSAFNSTAFTGRLATWQ